MFEAQYQEELGEQPEALAGGKDEILKDEVEDKEYATDAPDEGWTALFDLLIAAPKNLYLLLSLTCSTSKCVLWVPVSKNLPERRCTNVQFLYRPIWETGIGFSKVTYE